MTIEEFIAARLDEDEAIAAAARVAVGRQWDHDDYFVSSDGEPFARSATSESLSAVWPHLARHDPERTGRQVKRDRTIMHEHPRRGQDCGRCQDDFGDYNGADEWMPRNEVYPCPTVKAIASTWAEHPEFQPEWNTP